MPTALITGVTGQDGAYLSRLLLEKGYEVHGITRRASLVNTQRIDGISPRSGDPGSRFHLHYGDVTDTTNVTRIIAQVRPDEIYNLAAQSHVQVSFETPEYTANADAIGTLRILEALRTLDLIERVRFYQASTSELYGRVRTTPQNEETPFHPRSPYAVAKLYAYWITINYRESYGLFGCNGILFNHESPIRGESFVTRKITIAVARIKAGIQECLYVGNMDAKRDWGYAADYVEGMWRILQHDTADDFVLATGETHSVREFCERAFLRAGIELEFRGSGVDEVGVDTATGRTVLAVDPRHFRPAEVAYLVGDARRAHEILGWRPSVSFAELVEMMVDADIAAVASGQPFVMEESLSALEAQLATAI
jgi:GDPmannose 4,6-dehydratase